MSRSLLLLFTLLILAACSTAAPLPATPTALPTSTSMPTYTPEPTATPQPSPTASPTSVPTDVPNPKEIWVAPNGSDSNPGTPNQPLASPVLAAELAKPGQTVFFKGGTYQLSEQVQVKNSGTASAWITFTAAPGETPVLDFMQMHVGPPGSASPYPHDQGAFQIDSVQYIRVIGLKVTNSHNSGFTIRDSSHIDIINNFTDTTFSPGIAAWDTNHDSRGTEYIRILGNQVTNANTWDMIIEGFDRGSEPPHEAISIAGAQHFEVAYNHLFDSDKEGIDVKEVSKHGKVHHNHVERMDRQGIYVDAWFGAINDIEIYENVVHNCRGAGMVFSVENGEQVSEVSAHHNLIYNNAGTGIFFSRWGDGPRKSVEILKNTIYHNGYGYPDAGSKYFWITGGIYLYSANLEDLTIRDNIVADNRAFQIAYSEHYQAIDEDFEKASQAQKIVIDHNALFQIEKVTYPIYIGWPPNDFANAYSVNGSNALSGDPLFADPQAKMPDLRLKEGSPAQGMGAFTDGHFSRLWWVEDFPPKIIP